MYQKVSQGWTKHLDFIVLDIACLTAAFVLSYFIRNGISNPLESLLYRGTFLALMLLEIVVLFFFETLKNVIKRDLYKEFVVTVKHDCLVILLCSFYLFLTQSGGEYSRAIMISTGILYFIFSYSVRVVWKCFLRKKSKKTGAASRSLMIVTVSSMIDTVIKSLKQNNYQGLYLSGAVAIDKDMTGKMISGVPVVAGCGDVLEYACREWVDEVFICIPDEYGSSVNLVNHFIEMGITVHMELAKIEKLAGRVQEVERLGDYTVLTTTLNMASRRQLFIKRVLDICGGITGCMITAVLFVIFAPCIYIKSPGPIFFSQIRVGKNGKKFRIYKFRSMYMDAEKRKKELMEKNRVSDGMMFKLDWDPRIIGSEKGPDKGIGNFIRRYSIDEFPQFFNVLKGDMSLVGTRPPTLDEWEKYALHHRARLAIKPGLTGMWQVSGRSNITDFEEVVALDKKYITDWSLELDIKIILKTVLVVFGKKGSL